MRALTDELHRLLAPYDCPHRGPGRVLVVDDDDGVRSAMTKQLAFAGFTVLAASRAHEALEILAADRSIRVVLLDMLMPDLDGWGFRQAQLADASMAAVPVIVLTGAPLPSLLHDQLQAADYLLKPVGRGHLISVVSNYCEPATRAEDAEAEASVPLAGGELGFARP
jgi:CheY-like chemotaxis protein